MRKLNDLITKIILIFVSIIFSLCVGEVVARFIIKIPPYTYPKIFEEHPIRGFALKPNSGGIHSQPEFSVYYKINSEGFRDDERLNWYRNKLFTIIGLGDSFTFGNGVKLEDTFLSILERRINRDSLLVDIIKTGVMAYGTRDELDVLKTIEEKYLPNVVISFFYSNDIGENYKKFMVKEGDLIQYPSRFDRIKVFMAHHSRLYNLTTLAKKNNYVFKKWSNVLHFFRRFGNGKTYQPGPLSLDDMIKHTADLLLETKERASLLGSQYFIVIIPDKGEVYGENNDGYYRNRQIAVECQKRDIKVLDLLPYFREEVENNPKEHLYFERDPHFTPLGHRLVGKVLYRYLMKNSSQLGADLIFPDNRGL